MPSRSSQDVVDLLRTQGVVEFDDMRVALAGASRATVFRYLSRVPYRRSYNHNGRFYALHDPGRYDRHGLWSHGDIHFSRDGTLKDTVRRLVRESEAGQTRRELLELLRARVQPFLLDAVREGDLHREEIENRYVYFSSEAGVREAQVRRRHEAREVEAGDGIDDAMVIEVLLVLIRHPGASASDVARRLRGRAPPVRIDQVRAVFARYELGEKGGASTC